MTDEVLQTRRVALAQRLLILATLAFLAGIGIELLLPSEIAGICGELIRIAGIATGLFAVVAIARRVWSLLAAFWILIAALVSPYGIVFAFLVGGIAASRYLKKRGVKVGILGASREKLELLPTASAK